MKDLVKSGKLSEWMKLCIDAFEMVEHGDYSNGVEAMGVDEGEVRAAEYLQELKSHYAILLSHSINRDGYGYEDLRQELCKHAPTCPECKTDQVQLVEWIGEVKWKCRLCKTVFMWEIPHE